MKFINHATATSMLPKIKEDGRDLTYAIKKGEDWIPVRIEKPLAFDVPSVQSG